MSTWSTLRARWPIVALVALSEACWAWVLALLVAHAALAPLAHHPAGADTLVTEDGRLALDLALQHGGALERAATLGALGVAGYALVATLLGALLPAGLATPAPARVARTLRYALVRAPALVGLAVCALIGYALAALVAWGGLRVAWPAAGRVLDPRGGAALACAALVPGALVAYAVHVAHDAARVHLVGAPSGLIGAVARGVRRVVAGPRATLVAFVPYGLLSVALLAAGASAGGWRGPTRAAPLVAMIAVQQCVAALRVVVRAHWLARLARPYRESPPKSA